MTVKTCIAIVDAGRARLFVHVRTATPEGVQDELSEKVDLVEPGRRLREGARYSDSRNSANRVGSRCYGFDDHRTASARNEDAQFAARTTEEMTRLIAEAACRRVVVCASPRMLGLLRDGTAELRKRGLAVDELPRDLVKLTLPELREQLVGYGVIPPALERSAAAR